MHPYPLVVLVGPTAVGKTGVAIELCRRLGAEVVNADSVQVYQGLDIGSAKPTPRERALAPHHLVDVAQPDQEMSAARFAVLADDAIADIGARDKRVLVAGGTGLYIKALLWGLAPAPPVDPALRARLQEEWQAQGGEACHARLAALDPQSAARLHPADRQRVLRALEVCLLTGNPLSQMQAAHGFKQPRYAHLVLGLNLPWPELKARIAARCAQMWEQGLLDEVRGLLAGGLSPQARSLQTLGYRQALAVIAGGMDEATALAEMTSKTIAYAKRQLTWFRAIQGINWFLPQEVDALAQKAGEFWAEQDSRQAQPNQ